MENFEFIVEGEDAGQRLDVFLVDAFRKAYSRTFIKRLIDTGNVVVQGKTVNAHYLVQPDDDCRITVPDAEPLKVEAEPIPLDIVYKDQDIVVVNKQAGLVVHPAPGHYRGTLVNALLYHCGDLSGIGGVMRPGIVHRIDKDTSGLIVVAKNDTSHQSLSLQFKEKTAGRVYVALVKGIVQFDNGIIDEPIGRHATDRMKMDVTYEDSKDAITRYKVLQRFEDFTSLEATIETGRTHQIRVHLAHIGYPVLGDRVYGYFRGLDRQALHAKVLMFTHPRTGKHMRFEADLPDDMKEVIRRGKIERR
ncbi:MAG: RluA family pseudouridine synthase [Candidatus Omnitrophica bacterium]|nr:RluA family pseudouridine synthase [Candidatus Omnitrophota bacterium]